MSIKEAGPIAQKLNAIVHTEPLGTIVWGLYWTLFFIFVPFVGIPFVVIRATVRVICLYFGTSYDSPDYHPKQKPEYDMAVVITGCDTGFGKDLAIYAANAGYTVFAGCLHADKSKQQFETFTKIKSFQCDVTSDKECSNAAKIVNEWLKETSIPIEDVGRKRVLFAVVNNAGIGVSCETDTAELKDFVLSMDVNCFGQIRIVKSFLPILKEQAITKSFGNETMRILNMTSFAGLIDNGPCLMSYHVSKHAAQSFTTNLRAELAPFHIAVSSINPSFHQTPIVTTMSEKMSEFVANLRKEVKDQYGEVYFEKILLMGRFTCSWNSLVVVEQIMERGLFAKYPCPEIIIGMNAKFTAGFLRMLPTYIQHTVLGLVRPIPECMIPKTKLGKN